MLCATGTISTKCIVGTQAAAAMEHCCRFWHCLRYSSNRWARATYHPEDDVRIVDNRTFRGETTDRSTKYERGVCKDPVEVS